jgi:hypothetical protein
MSVLGAFAIPLALISTRAEAPQQKSSSSGEAQSASGGGTPTIELMDSSVLSILVPSSFNPSATTTVFIRNDSAVRVDKLTFYAALQDEAGRSYFILQDGADLPQGTSATVLGHITLPDDSKSLDAFGAKPFQLIFNLNNNLPLFEGKTDLVRHTLTGYLFVDADKKVVKNRGLKLAPQTPSHYAAYPILIGLVCALVIIGSCAGLLYKKLGNILGLPEFTLSGSMATNLAAIGLLMPFLTSLALPSITHNLQKGEYNTLAFFFGILAGLAPIVYNSIRIPAANNDAAGGATASKSQGYVIAFLGSSAVTLWALFGQLSTFYFLVGELWEARFIAKRAVDVFQGLIIIIMGLMVVYSVITIVRNGKTSVPPDKVASAPAPESASAADDSKRVPPNWPLL